MRESLYLEGNEQIIDVLKNLPVFKPFTEDSLKNLIRLSKIRTYAPTEMIITEGERENAMYLLISGRVSISKNDKTIVTLQRNGDIFGEMSLLDDEPRSASVTAKIETSCLVIDAEYLETLDEEGKNSFHSAIYQMFSQILAYRLRVTTEKYTSAKQEIERLKKEITRLR